MSNDIYIVGEGLTRPDDVRIVQWGIKNGYRYVETNDGTRCLEKVCYNVSDCSYFKCSRCYYLSKKITKYCPNCGAKVINYDYRS